ncbi:hypothetical protein CYMTET_19401 [Cymbomonas tetramitiformis]|uniref:ABC transporter domain-containing protein n=1 Tax=Cymbomonas tetramitiformis TaxID=36881 RepID=A0AAE0G6N3_9CHLO|nr:hypothetical protein CYMTET_19401 [Cymbomonas tetramitiformis]
MQALSAEDFFKAYADSKYFKHSKEIAMAEDTSLQWFRLKRPTGCVLAGSGNKIFVRDIHQDGHLERACRRADSLQVKSGDRLLGYRVIGGGGDSRLVFDGTEKLEDIIEVFQGDSGEIMFLVEHCTQHMEKPPSEFTKQQFMRHYIQEPWESTKTVLRREFLILRTNAAFIKTRCFQAFIIALLNGTLYWGISDDPDKMSLRTSVFFVSIMSLCVSHMAQVPKLLDQRAVFYKQHGAGFFRASSYILSTNLAQIPVVMLELTIFCPFVYFAVGLSSDNGGAHFFFFVLVIFCTCFMMSSVVRAICSVMPAKEPAQMLCILMIMMNVLLAGFIVYKPNVPDFWIWYYWINPFQWSLSAMEINEFTSPRWDGDCSPAAFPETCNCNVIVQGNTTITECDETLGLAFLKFYEFEHRIWYAWMAVLVISLHFLAAFLINVYGFTFLKFDEVQAIAIAKDSVKKDARRQRLATTNTIKTESSSGNQLSLDFPRLTLSWHKLCYDVTIPGLQEMRRLLNDVSGFAKPEEMIALMGSSGAGKTTLLDVIACRKTTGAISGEVLVNGYPQDADSFARYTGYVEQMDIHVTYATVHEALWFSGRLRLDESISDERVKAFLQCDLGCVEYCPV